VLGSLRRGRGRVEVLVRAPASAARAEVGGPSVPRVGQGTGLAVGPGLRRHAVPAAVLAAQPGRVPAGPVPLVPPCCRHVSRVDISDTARGSRTRPQRLAIPSAA
jgi:hypothetical protein